MVKCPSLSSLPKPSACGFAQVREEESCKTWKLWSTPLEKYTSVQDFLPSPPRFDFRAYLQEKLLDARKNNQTLKVLDVGVGTGRQWADIVNQSKGALDVSFTVCQNLDAVRPYFREKAVACFSSDVASMFPHGKFDIVVTHYGAHYQLAELIVAAHSLLVPGGEAILSGQKELHWVGAKKSRVWAYEHVLGKCAEYSLLSVDPPIYDSKNIHWFLHLKKN